MNEARDRLIVGLDCPDCDTAEGIVEDLGDAVSWYKIGYQLAYAGGLDLARDLAADGKRVFLDLKLLDIPNTVARGVENVARLGAAMTTVHAYPQAMRAAAEGAAGSDLAVLGVTVLTSMDADDLAEAGYGCDVAGLVARRAGLAREIGLAGCVGAVSEAATLRETLGPAARVVTPGIRPAEAARDDQKRVATPAEALAAGASHLVVARPIVEAPEPRVAVEQILSEMAAEIPGPAGP